MTQVVNSNLKDGRGCGVVQLTNEASRPGDNKQANGVV